MKKIQDAAAVAKRTASVFVDRRDEDEIEDGEDGSSGEEVAMFRTEMHK